MGRRFDHLAVANPNYDWHFTAAALRRRRSHAAGVSYSFQVHLGEISLFYSHF
jgi:hypothetical protein